MSYFSNKNVLVAGAAGLLGHASVKRLLAEGAHVRATQHNRPVKITHKNLEIVNCDFFDTEQCNKVLDGIDVVVNCVAYVMGIAGQNENQLNLVKNNLIPSINLADACVRKKIDVFVSIGSSTMYPPVTYPVKEEQGFEGEPFHGYHGIGWVKRFLEKSYMYYHNISTTKFVLLRSAAMYGPHDNFTPNKGHVIPDTIIKAVNKTNPYYVWGDGTAVRDFVYVDDFIDGMISAVKNKAFNNPINIATGSPTTIKALVETTTRLSGYSPEIIYDPTKPTAIPFRLINVEKAKNLLNWSSSTSLESGLEKTITWYKENL
jgi:GDP-L-fucose synthase